MLSDGAEVGCDPVAITPILEHAAPELLALVTDDVFRDGTCVVDDAFEEALDRFGRGIVLKCCEAHHPSRVVVDDHPHPPAKWPTLWSCERQPWRPKAHGRRYRGKSDMPDMIRPLCCYDASRRRRISGVRLWLFFQDPPDRRCAQMQPCPAQCLGDLDLADTLGIRVLDVARCS